MVRALAAAPGGDSGSGPRARAPDVGLGPCVRVSERVSHGLRLSIAHGESKRRGRGSSTAGGHTGNGHGPRALGAGLRGAGRGSGHRPGRAVTWAARRSVRPPRSCSVRTPRPALRGPRLQTPDGTGQHKPNLSLMPPQLLYCNARSFHRTERISRPRSPTRKIHSSDSPRPHPRFSAASRIRGTCFSFPVALPWGRGPALFIFAPLKIQYSGTLRGILLPLDCAEFAVGKPFAVCVKWQWLTFSNLE